MTAALWLSPVGIGSLIAASILRACDLLGGWVGGWVGGRVGDGAGDGAPERVGCMRLNLSLGD